MSLAARSTGYGSSRSLRPDFVPDEPDECLAEQKKLLESGEFREESGVEVGTFAALLVGKDGTGKFRSGISVKPDELFRRIDEMPMRRREMDS